ncbi:hypothetical protein M409DRAFT_68436 [Zasmidium cellare ATCC 36951]|uniref:Major facilitator superfamily (MFS) profile domain-containing protein n=1 Tax=Zasmidium cellare ATCC 36951 TaxID=1080233 RepID=A0A6A6CDJ5_ZASCE|nr:uncharacterized protein M409DRAFT_68436 [Zasmidium cellare ATCC 36951]KAF2163506.1 hypothetical protein M409DRAFT_68436 [Zasmidium cellare ATCC 36951]
MEIEEVRPPRTKLRLYAILIGLYLCVFIGALDETILATSIPTIASQLHSATGYAWIASAYFLANAASGPIWAKFSDIWGRKLALLSAVAIFFATSIMAALSNTSRVLIAARALQGTGAGGLNQIALIVISDLFSMRQRTIFLGLTNVCWGLAGGVGPLLGGAFTEYASWRWCFWVNLPICAVSFVLLALLLDVHNPRTGLRDGFKAFDWLGTVAIVGVTLMVLMGLDFGGVTFAWDSATVICLIVFGVLLIGFFVFAEKRVAKYPLMPMQIFSNLSTNASFLVCFTHGMVFIGLDYYTPLYTQSVKGATPLQSGLLVLPEVLPSAVIGVLAGYLMLKTGHYREVIWLGAALFTLGTGLYIMFDITTTIGLLVGVEVIAGLGRGFLFEPPMVALQAVTAQDDTAAATATFCFTRNMATTMSIVVGAVVFQNGMDQQSPALRAAGLNNTLVEAFSGANAQANVEMINAIQDPGQKRAVEAAFADGMKDMWIMYTCIIAVGLVASFFIKHADLRTEHTETRTGILKRREGEVGEEA